MSGAWTPGPWAFHKRGQRVYGGKTGGMDVAQVRINPDFEANGHLIAAAPDMYAALLVAELASEELCQGQDPANECWVTLATIRAAIAKARGEAE